MQTLNEEEQEKFKTSIGLFEVVSENLSHSTMSQYCPCKIAN